MGCDVSNYDSVLGTLEVIMRTHEVHGLFHLAGLLMDVSLTEQTPETLSKVLDAKLLSGWNLHRALQHFREHGLPAVGDEEERLIAEPQHFVMFSSVSSAVGNIKQCNYSAANAGLDSLVQYRRQLGLPGVSIQWGPWTEQGMALGMEAVLEKAGMRGLSNDIGLRCLADVLHVVQASAPVVCVQQFRWSSFLQRYDVPPTFFSSCVKGAMGGVELSGKVAKMTEEERKQYVLQTVIDTASSVLGRTELPPMDAPLQDLGIDSLGAVEFRNSLQNKLGIKLAATAMFDYPTLRGLGEHIHALVEEKVAMAAGVSREVDDSSFLLGAGVAQGGGFAAGAAAIVGASLCMPGDCVDLDSFWDFLCQGRSGIVDLPLDRFDVEVFYDKTISANSSMVIRQSGFIHDAMAFDADFFHITPAELLSTDPQQRLLLEQTYYCLLSAGYNRETVVNQEVAVFTGCCNFDWHYLDQYSSSPFAGVGGSGSIVSNRVSYTFGLKGPSVTVDTACSSSLVAVDAALSKLRRGTPEALVGGVNLLLTPHLFATFGRARMLALDSKCKTFDARADGYVRGEGCGVVLLQPVEEARRQGRFIYGIVRGSAVNHDGRSASLTAPNGPAQQDVIRTALRDAGVRPTEVAYVEAHGTGTALGDPIEAGGLKAVYAAGRDTRMPLVVGALKTNIGHLEGAAGIAGLIKVMLCLEHREVPRNLHFEQLNPHIDVENFPVVFPQANTPLTQRGVLYSGVSSFGFGGTNAHVVLEGVTSQLLPSIAKLQVDRSILSRRPHAAHYKVHPFVGKTDIKPTGQRWSRWALRNDFYNVLLRHHCVFDQVVVPGVLLLESIAALLLCTNVVEYMGVTVITPAMVTVKNMLIERPIIVPTPVEDAREYSKVRNEIQADGSFTIDAQLTETGTKFVPIASGLLATDSVDGVVSLAGTGTLEPGDEANDENRNVGDENRNAGDENRGDENSGAKDWTTKAADPATAGGKVLREVDADFLAAYGSCTYDINPTELYEQLEAAGLRYGPKFRTVSSCIHLNQVEQYRIRVKVTRK
ncbi:polyketide synthase type I [Gregarina niphandrodes]|uniref:Polyketide synthase type I n=1 Tax=Gregarina niphandrodes TaxID=110365 RepID=A0A023AZW9_GRENI|nr:polyketide synthase type I [Gregarina niphandrodes]EZG44532.1 polyketide synthase type I [Gregarina niphandrodes]|eukprot:XP_011134165.1 polyketide synthase type I [Gregarina niphandrodes]